MRAVVQRVTGAQVSVGNEMIGSIGPGVVALIGVQAGDTEKDAAYLAEKITKLRIFSDQEGKMNLSLTDTGGEAMLVSQFTLLGDARGQNRPGFTAAEEPEEANRLFELCCETLRARRIRTAQGVFRAHMSVSLVNDGPVTILLDSRKIF